MRPIKFRAWDKEQKEMCSVMELSMLFETENGICASVPDIRKGTSKVFRDIFPENLELMQFTGLLDKNGLEIFEGDIVKNKYDDNWKVYFAEGIGAFRLEATNQTDFNDFYRGEDYEVIGNIYENPGLLKTDT